jgi:hypothetical protein
MADDSVGRVLHSRHTVLSDPTAKRRGIQQLLSPQSAPAASSFSAVVSGSYWERILTFSANVVTSSTGGIRQFLFQVFNGDGSTFVSVPVLAGIGASKNVTVYGNQGYPSPLTYPVSQTGYGTQTSPAAGTSICSTTAPGIGDYDLAWTVELQGTTTAGTDNDNFGLYANGSLIEQSVNGFELGTYPQVPQDSVNVAAGIFSVKNINLATTGAVYSASLVVTPLTAQSGIFTIPDIMLEPGWGYGLTGFNLQTGDQISNVQILLERYASDYANGGWQLEQEYWLREVIRSELESQRNW